MAGDPGIGGDFDAAGERGEAARDIEPQRAGMVERAAVQPDAIDSRAPGAAQRLGHQPAAMALSGQPSNQPDERQFACADRAKIELEHARLCTAVIDHGEYLDRVVGDDFGKRAIAQGEARKPQPVGADEAEQRAIGGEVGRTEPFEAERRGRRRSAIGRRRHLERGDDARNMPRRHRGLAHSQIASGGRLIRIASILPPVLRPNSVPRS